MPYLNQQTGLFYADNGAVYKITASGRKLQRIDPTTGSHIGGPLSSSNNLFAKESLDYVRGVADGSIEQDETAAEGTSYNPESRPSLDITGGQGTPTGGGQTGETGNTGGGGTGEAFSGLFGEAAVAQNEMFENAADNVNLPFTGETPNTSLQQQGLTGTVAETNTSGEAEKVTSQQGTENETVGTVVDENVNTSTTERTDTTQNEVIANNEQTGLDENTRSQTESENLSLTNENLSESGRVVTDETATGGRRVSDEQGFGAALGGALEGAQAGDDSRLGALMDLVNNGGVDSGFQGRMDQAISQSLSGRNVAQAGGSAKDRVASRAAAEVGQQSIQNLLNATNQLGDAGAVVDVAGAGAAYTGEDTFENRSGVQDSEREVDSAGTNLTLGNETSEVDRTVDQTVSGTTERDMTGSTDTAGTSEVDRNATTDVDRNATTDITGNEKTNFSQTELGKSLGQLLGISFGTQPEGPGGGGSIICAVLNFHGYLDSRLVKEAALYAKNHQEELKYCMAGYLLYAPAVAKWLLKHRRACRFFAPMAKSVSTFAKDLNIYGEGRDYDAINFMAFTLFHSFLGRLAVFFGKHKFNITDKNLVFVLERLYAPIDVDSLISKKGK